MAMHALKSCKISYALKPKVKGKNMPSHADFETEYQNLKTQFLNMSPELEVTVRDPSLGVEGFVVVWNTGISQGGPLALSGKGGTRVTKDLTLQDVKRLARAMAEKNASAGLPLGGAKSGLKLDPNDPAYEEKYRRFVQLCKPFLQENGGPYAGFGYDVGSKPPYNALWACDTLKSLKSFTGKPVDMGGTDYDREGIAGLGVAVAAHTALAEYGETSQQKSFAVQGLGAMGGAIVRYFSEYGGILKYLSDPKYGGTWEMISAPSTELIEAIAFHDFAQTQNLLNIEARLLSSDCAQVLYQNVDVLFPAALEDSITADNAAKIKARYMAEGANNPTTEDAHTILHQQNIIVIPDIIANAGGIIAAYVEMTSDVSAADNAKNKTNVMTAKAMTRARISDNTKKLIALSRLYNKPWDKLADFMAWQNIFHTLQR
jgi:glutamate dehydrogenase (NAD(P)+)